MREGEGSVKPYYQRGPVTFYLGDAREVLPGLSERGHVIFDAPYSEHTHSKARAGARKLHGNTAAGTATSKANISHSVSFGFEHLSPSFRRCLAAHASRLVARWALSFSDTESDWLWRLSFSAAGLRYVRTAFWHKVGSTPQFTGDCPAVAVEAITIAHAIGVGRKRWNGGGKAGLYSVPIVLERGGVPQGNESRIHTTQKPERLMLALVDDFTDPGELVYDFTAGSCTTGIGCLRGAGGPRRFIGIEREEKWIEAGAKRLDAELDGSTYHAAKAGQLGMFPQ